MIACLGSLLVATSGCRLVRNDKITTSETSCPPAACESCESGECSLLYSLPSEHYVRCIDEQVTIHEALQRANTMMRYDYDAAPSADVQDGYRSAFQDIALGGTGEVPPVPPQRYWSTCYRTADGYNRAQAWFAGYATGASRALSSCRQVFNHVPSSGRTGYDNETTSSTTQDPMTGETTFDREW